MGNSSSHGGARKGAGRPKKAAFALPLGMAQDLQAMPETKERWLKLMESNDDWLRFRVLQYLWDRAEGKPTIFVAQEPEKPPAEVTFGSLSTPSADKPGKVGKPN